MTEWAHCQRQVAFFTFYRRMSNYFKVFFLTVVCTLDGYPPINKQTNHLNRWTSSDWNSSRIQDCLMKGDILTFLLYFWLFIIFTVSLDLFVFFLSKSVQAMSKMKHYKS